MGVAENTAEIKARIAQAAKRAGRSQADVTLIGVTKTVEPPAIAALMAAGVYALGENRVQELLRKYGEPTLAGAEWHLIGHLQTNKAKYIVDKAALIHSVDSSKLAAEIDRRAARRVDVLVEINIADEPSKHGVCPQAAEALVAEICRFEHIRVRGLMCVAPFVANPAENRAFFEKMRKIFIDIRRKSLDNGYMDILSMGMTNDFEVAIEEGATMVRVGTGIFGSR